MQHTMNFANNEEMSYCASHLDCFVSASDIQENEFDGDHENEVTFSTAKPIPQTVIKKMVKHFEPAGQAFNK